MVLKRICSCLRLALDRFPLMLRLRHAAAKQPFGFGVNEEQGL